MIVVGQKRLFSGVASGFRCRPESRRSRPDVRFLADDFSFTLESGLGAESMSSSVVDPKETSALPLQVEHWSLTTLWEKLIKIGAKIVRHGRYITFQLGEVAIPRALFAEILRLIGGLRPAPLPP